MNPVVVAASAIEAPVSAATPKVVEETPKETRTATPPTKILVVDIGGTKIKVLASGQTEPRKAASGKGLSPIKMVEAVKELADDWEYEAVSIGVLPRHGKAGTVPVPNQAISPPAGSASISPTCLRSSGSCHQ